MTEERLPVTEPAEARRAAGELARTSHMPPPTHATATATATASNAHRRLRNHTPKTRHPVTRNTEQGTPEEVAR